jgi:hypothetical protein
MEISTAWKNAHSECVLIHDDFMVSGFDKTTCDVFQLLASLNKEVISWRDTDWDTFAGVACPDM